MYRTPHVYGYFVAALKPTANWDFSLSGNYTGNMLTGHEIPTEDDGSLTLYNGKPAAQIDADRMMHGEGQTATTYGARTFRTPSFFELGAKVAYHFDLHQSTQATIYVGVQNLFNSFQNDFDKGPSRDSAYTYGPSAPRSFYAGLRLSF